MFGYQKTVGTTDSYFDFRLTLTGGLLAPMYAGRDLGMTVASEQCGFTGTFDTSFTGGAKGNLGGISLPATIGDLCGTT